MFIGQSKKMFGSIYIFGNYENVDLCQILDISDVMKMFQEFTTAEVVDYNLMQCEIINNLLIIEWYSPLSKYEINDIDKWIKDFIKDKKELEKLEKEFKRRQKAKCHVSQLLPIMERIYFIKHKKKYSYEDHEKDK